MRHNMTRIFKSACVAALMTARLFAQAASNVQADPLAAFDIQGNLTNPDFPNVLTSVPVTARQQFIDYVRGTNAFRGTFRSLLQSVENGRVDEQAGASATAGGTASAAEKAGISGLVTAALESGALTQTLDQNLLTIRGNAEGLFRFLSGQDVIPMCFDAKDTSCDPSPLNKLELTASFDVSNSNTQAVTGQNASGGATLAALLTSEKRQFSSASARFAIIDSRDLRSKKYRDAWAAWFDQNKLAIMQSGRDLLTTQDPIFLKMQQVDSTGNPVQSVAASVYGVWKMKADTALLNVRPRTEAGVHAVLAEQLNLLVAELRKIIPDLDDKILTARNAYNRYYANTSGGFELGNQPMLTLEGSYLEPTLQPKLINAKFAFAWSPKKKGTLNPGTLTINGGVSAYTKPQPSDTLGNTSRWHDAQFAFQFDRPLDSKALSALTIGGYFQYQISPGLVNIPPGATSPPGTNITLPPNGAQLLSQSKGLIGVAQASLTLQLPNTGIRVPIGISWSNRTELLTGNEIRGHIGFSFDTHSMALLGK